MKKVLSAAFIPLGICIGLVLVSLFMALSQNYIIDKHLYLGIFMLTIALVLFFIKPKLYIIWFTITLLIGMFGFIEFFFIRYSFGIKDEFSLNPLFILLIVIFLFFSKPFLNTYFPDKNR